jgi:hypothetical protein
LEILPRLHVLAPLFILKAMKNTRLFGINFILPCTHHPAHKAEIVADAEESKMDDKESENSIRYSRHILFTTKGINYDS